MITEFEHLIYKNSDNISNIPLNDLADLYQPKTISGNELISDGKYFVYGANGIIGKYNEYNHETNQIAVACRGASCGVVTMTLPNSWITGNAMVVNPKSNFPYKEYLYYTLLLKNISYLSTGSAQPQLTRENMLHYLVPLINNKSIIYFEEKASKYRKKMILNELENIQLISLRKIILPLLINGQLNIK